MLVGPHNGGINHGVFVIRIFSQSLEHALPNPALAPAAVPGMNNPEVAKALRQVPPRNARPVAVQHSIHKQTVVFCRRPHPFGGTWQHILDPLPLIIPQRVSSTHENASFPAQKD